MTDGLTPTGFNAKTLQTIQAELGEAYLAKIDAGLDLSPDQPFGQARDIAAQREAILWELLATLANAINPSAAEGFLADNIAAISGTIRQGAKKSFVDLDCLVTAGFIATAGQMMANVANQPTVRFVNKLDVGPLSAGLQSIRFEALDYGPIVANAGTLTVRTNTVAGWDSCTNTFDATIGSDREQDADLMSRREKELAAAGACTTDALRAGMLKVVGVEQCFVFENTTDTTDADGLPPHSTEVVIYDGITPAASDADIGAVLWKHKPSGGPTHGSTSVVTPAADGSPRTVFFSRATVVPVWLDLPWIVIDTNAFPPDGETQIKTAIATKAQKILNLGIDVVALKMRSAAEVVPGVLDVPTLHLDRITAPGATDNIVIAAREIAAVDTSRITLTTVPGTP